MTSALPLMSGAEAIAALATAGFIEVSQRGQPHQAPKRDGTTVIVPRHRELARGTLRSILRQAGLRIEEFVPLL